MEIYYTYTCRYIAKFEMNSSSCGLAAKTLESPFFIRLFVWKAPNIYTLENDLGDNKFLFVDRKQILEF